MSSSKLQIQNIPTDLPGPVTIEAAEQLYIPGMVNTKIFMFFATLAESR